MSEQINEGQWEAPPPAWIALIYDRFTRFNAQGQPATIETYQALLGFLSHLEVDHFPQPACQIVGPRLVRLTWTSGVKSMRLEVGPRSVSLTTSHPDPAGMPLGRGQLVDAARATFEWFRHPHATRTRRNQP